MKTLVVTGGIATGKSTAIRLLMEMGAPHLRLFDCDAEAGRLLDSGLLKDALIRAFGPGSVDGAGRADRHFLRELVFRNPESRKFWKDYSSPAAPRMSCANAGGAAECGGKRVCH